MITIMVNSTIPDYWCRFDVTYRKGVVYDLTRFDYGPNPSLSKPYPIWCKCATLGFLAQMHSSHFHETSTREMIAIKCFESISKRDL